MPDDHRSSSAMGNFNEDRFDEDDAMMVSKYPRGDATVGGTGVLPCAGRRPSALSSALMNYQHRKERECCAVTAAADSVMDKIAAATVDVNCAAKKSKEMNVEKGKMKTKTKTKTKTKKKKKWKKTASAHVAGHAVRDGGSEKEKRQKLKVRFV